MIFQTHIKLKSGIGKGLCGAVLLSLVAASNGFAQSKSQAKLQSTQNIFTTAPDSIQTSVYWYWISDNISKEGVIKDLEAMKKVGINRAFIGNIGLDEIPYGKAKMFSDEWWDVLHTALKTATRLNIQIGLFNGPGWSQSGGPWIKPEQSMRYLTSSQTMVKGPLAFNSKLAIPHKNFQDVKVLAYPVAADYSEDISSLHPKLSADQSVDSLNNLMDGKLNTAVQLKDSKLTLMIAAPSKYTARSLTINTTQKPGTITGDIQAKINNEYVTLKHFTIDRSNPALNTGFIPYGPATISIPATTASEFRLIISKASPGMGIGELKLSSTPMVENYIEKSLAKMWPTPHPNWDSYQWPQQPVEASKYVIDPSKVVDVTKFMSADGTLNWQVPAGNWIIERTGMAPTEVTNAPAPPEGRGREVDKLSKEHVADHFKAFLGEIQKRIPAEDRKSWKVTVEDSYETGSQNWTDAMLPEFKAKYHYDPIPYLPVLQGKVVGSEEKSDRFLWDLRRLVADDVSFKYVGGLRDVSHQHGLTTWLENYGHWGYPGEFLQYGGQSDEIGGEFWSGGDLGDIENRAASSSAHIYGKTKVSAESFTAAGNPFGRYPAVFKKRGDRFFTEGINNTLLHVYVHQPEDVAPGLTAWFGVEFNRHNTWFFDMDVLLKYLKRCNYMLQQGHYIADVAYFIGEDAPVMTGVINPALPAGYSFDYMNADVIKQRITVKNGKLMLPNSISYNILVLPQMQTMRPELLTRIKELVQQGAVVLGPKPLRSPSMENYPSADQQVKTLAAQLWGKVDGKTVKVNRYGKGMVISGMDMQQALNLVKVQPDAKITGSDSILFIHRQLADASVYFVSNQKTVPVKFKAAFRINGKRPELWNAIDGSTRELTAYKQSGGTTTIPLELAPLESAFIVFRNPSPGNGTGKSNYPSTLKTDEITQPWTVQFDQKMRGPAQPVTFTKLTDWSESDNDAIKYYSGTAVYHNTFNVDKVEKGNRYIIDLGLARAIAKVTVNGVEVGGTWTPPYQVDITSALKPGTNKLEIKVVNTWLNRLAGDAKLPAAERKTSVIYGPKADTKLEPSGLLGPVKILTVKY